MITNYTQLKTEVADFAHRTDLTAKMDTFCQLAEALINKDLRVLEMEHITNLNSTTDYVALPADYLELVLVFESTGSNINSMTNVPIDLLTAKYGDLTGTTRYYSIVASLISFRPGASVADPVELNLTYYRRVPSLTSNTTNDVLDAYPMIYFTAMMIQLNIYLHDEEQTGVWVNAYQTQIQSANKHATAAKTHLPQVRMI